MLSENTPFEEEKLDSARSLDRQLDELLRSKSIEEKQSSEAIRDLYFIRDHLELYSTIDAVSVSARIAGLVLSEINNGGSIIIKHKSGVSSKIKIA